MKKTVIFLFSALLLVGCAKEEFLNKVSTDNVSAIFYFNGTIEDTTLSKNFAWYDTRSFYSNYKTEILDELRFNYSWDSRQFLNSNTNNYSSDYYSHLTGGSITVELYDSTLLPSILGKTVRSDQFGDTLKVNLTLGLHNYGYKSNGSAFDFRINSVKDSAIVYHLNKQTENFKIYSISIPKIILRNRDDTTQTKEVTDLEMRFPVIIWD